MCVRLPDWCLLFTQALMWVIAGTACNLKWRRNDLVPLCAAATPLSAPQPGAPWAPYMETSGREGGGPCRLGRLGCKRNKKMKEFPARTNKKEGLLFYCVSQTAVLSAVTLASHWPAHLVIAWLMVDKITSLSRWSPQTDREFLALGWNYRRQFKMQCGECNFASSKYWSVCSVFQRLLRSCAVREQGGKHASNSPLSSPLKFVFTQLSSSGCVQFDA